MIRKILHFARSTLARNSILFAAPMAVFAVSGLLSIPVLLNVVSPERWSAIVASQAIGGFAAIFIAFGWGATGPITAARTSVHERGTLYVQSLTMRASIALIVLIPATFLACWVSGFDATIAISALGAAIPGMSATWYFIGLGQPIDQLWLDTVPRVGGVLTGLLLTLVFRDALPYVLLTALGAVIAVVVSSRRILKSEEEVGRAFREAARFRVLWRQVLAQRSGAVTVIASSTYANLPVVLVQAINPGAAPVFNMAFKIMRYGAIALLPLMQSVQAWTPKNPLTRERLYQALIISCASSVMVGVGVSVFSNPVSLLLSHDQIALGFVTCFAIGLSIFCIGLSQHVGLTGLVLVGKQRTVAVSTVIGAAFGAPAIAVSAYFWADAGAMLATALAEAAVLVWQIRAYLPALRKFEEG